MPDHAKLHFSGRLLALQTRNVEGFAAIIADYFKLPTSSGIHARMDSPAAPVTLHAGRFTRYGNAGIDRDHRERIKVHHLNSVSISGPLSLEEYERLLPTGFQFGAARALVAEL